MNTSILIYQTDDGVTKIETRLEAETVWLTQAQLAELFQKSRVTITEHIKNIFKEGELTEDSVCRKFRHTAVDGKEYETNFYNLDVIISVGYRVKSHQGTKFRQWATARLREYIVKGFTIDNDIVTIHQSATDELEEIYNAEVKRADDNPAIGILLCTEKGKKLVEYATAGMDNHLFVSKYLLELPKKEQLEAFILKEMEAWK